MSISPDSAMRPGSWQCSHTHTQHSLVNDMFLFRQSPCVLCPSALRVRRTRTVVVVVVVRVDGAHAAAAASVLVADDA